MERYSGLQVKLARGEGAQIRDEYARGAKGKIFLPTATARAVWEHEILGQMSDGQWENSTPSGHWIFWQKMEVASGEPHTEADRSPTKDSYALTALISNIGDRMVALGRLAEAGATDGKAFHASEYMPKTYEEFMKGKAEGFKPDYIAKYMEVVTPEMAKKFYESKYNENDLRRDLALIKKAMKTVQQVHEPAAPVVPPAPVSQ